MVDHRRPDEAGQESPLVVTHTHKYARINTTSRPGALAMSNNVLRSTEQKNLDLARSNVSKLAKRFNLVPFQDKILELFKQVEANKMCKR